MGDLRDTFLPPPVPFSVCIWLYFRDPASLIKEPHETSEGALQQEPHAKEPQEPKVPCGQAKPCCIPCANCGQILRHVDGRAKCPLCRQAAKT